MSMSGSVAEWSKALVLGTSHFDGVGSNPTTANNFFYSFYRHSLTYLTEPFATIHPISLS